MLRRSLALAFASGALARADRNRLGSWVLGIWLLLHLVMMVRGALPLPEPWSAKVPWGMFSTIYARDNRLEYTAIFKDGHRRQLNIADYFSYTRGFTELRVPDDARHLRKPWRAAAPGSAADLARAEFARWLAKPLLQTGQAVDAIEIHRVSRAHSGGKVRRRKLGRWPATTETR